MADVSLNATLRSILGKQVRSLRRQGLVPANVYGRNMESVPVQFDLRDLRGVLLQAGTTTVVDLHIQGGDGHDDGRLHPVLIETVQRNPANGHVLHVDFRQVDLKRPVRASVQIVLSGEAPAAERGSVIVQALDTLEVEALPGDLVQEIVVDISSLVDNTSQIAVSDVPLPPGVTAQADPATIVVSVVASRLEEEVAAEDAVTAEAAASDAAEAEGAAPEASGTGEDSSQEGA